MIGFDLLIDKKVDDNELLLKSISKVLNLEKQKILICDEIPEPLVSSEIQLIVAKGEVRGDMRLLLEFYPQPSFKSNSSPLDVAIGLSHKIACRCLLEDEKNNPYTFFLIDQDRVNNVMLDTLEIDENEKYILK